MSKYNNHTLQYVVIRCGPRLSRSVQLQTPAHGVDFPCAAHRRGTQSINTWLGLAPPGSAYFRRAPLSRGWRKQASKRKSRPRACQCTCYLVGVSSADFACLFFALLLSQALTSPHKPSQALTRHPKPAPTLSNPHAPSSALTSPHKL